METLKRWAALLLCGALLLALAACGTDGGSASGQNGGGQNGRYVETDITPPGCEDESLASFITPEGTLVCYNQSLTRRFESTDGGDSWTESDGPFASLDAAPTVDNLALLADGRLLASLMSPEGYGVSGLVTVQPDGTVEPFAVPRLDELVASGKTTYLSLLKVLSDNRLLLSFSAADYGMDPLAEGDAPAEGDQSEPDGDSSAPQDEDDPAASGDDSGDSLMFYGGGQEYVAALFDLETGELVADFSEWYGLAAAADEENLYLLDHNGEVLVKSLADGSAQNSDTKVPVGEFAFNLTADVGKDGLVVLDGKQIMKIAAGAEPETLMNGSAYAFSDPSNYARALHTLQNGDLVVNASSAGGSRLYRYHYDENAVLDEAQVLRVWSLRENFLMRAAISALRRQNPDLVVEYEVALQEGTAVTEEDAIKNLNTRLLNGDGPDVMLLDGCPADNYATRGMLKDLRDVLDTSGMFQNLLQPFSSEDGLFYLPVNFSLPVLLGTPEALAGLDDLQKLATRVQEGEDLPVFTPGQDGFANIAEEKRPVLSPDGLREVFDLLWNSSAGTIIDENGLHSNALRQMLAALLDISDKYSLGSEQENSGGAMVAMAMAGDGGGQATVQGAVLAYASQRALLGPYLSNDMQMLAYMMDPPGTQMQAFPGMDKGSFVPVGLAAINADTEKEELAAQFVQALLGDDVQGVRSGLGFPVTQSGFEKQISTLDTILRQNAYAMGGQEEGFTFDYEQLVALAQTPTLADSLVTGMVWATAQELCQGKIDLDGAVKQLEQSLKNYLAERQ